MKKTACWLLMLLIIGLSGNSQRIALIGGLGSAKVIEKNQVNVWDSAAKPYYSSRTGIHFGILGEIPLTADQRWQFQPGIVYQSKGKKFFRLYDSLSAVKTDTILSRKNTSVNYIEFPLNICFKFSFGKTRNIIVSAGPYLGLFYNGKEITETRFNASSDFNQDIRKLETGSGENKIKTTDIGLNARFGIETSKLFVSAFISQGLSNFYTAPYKSSFRHRVAGISIGFFLNKGSLIEKKIRDKDLDGIPDDQDTCPEIAGSIISNGCPDQDGDCIVDKSDSCPARAGIAKYIGCPIPDTDGDGVNDEVDKCIDVSGNSKYAGCPVPDTDGDGLNDESDSCKDVSGDREFNGCPIPDTDGDGLNDKEDKCPNETGTVKNNGCPDAHEQMVELVNLAARNIFYERSSDKISTISFGSLDEVAVILKNNPDLHLEISGHSDNTGKAEINLKLSEKRALAVKKYLETLGVEVSRLKAKGFGMQQPIAPNNFEEGRAKNRRVELKLIKV